MPARSLHEGNEGFRLPPPSQLAAPCVVVGMSELSSDEMGMSNLERFACRLHPSGCGGNMLSGKLEGTLSSPPQWHQCPGGAFCHYQEHQCSASMETRLTSPQANAP